MLKFAFDKENTRTLNILCLGSHCDDLEIGCGGSILKLIEEFEEVHVLWLVFSSDDKRAKEANTSAGHFLAGVKNPEITILDYPDGYFPFSGSKIKDQFEELKGKVQPDVIFTHFRHDLHQDHRLINELTWNTFRDHLILEYEIPKYDGDLGQPNFFVHLDEQTLGRKIKVIMGSFRSQRKKSWFREDTFRSLARIRGMESNSPSGYAEAFYLRKGCY